VAAAHETYAPSAAEEAALGALGFEHIAGVDEAGRGAWAGPVVAGAVILPDLRARIPDALAPVRDSKLVPPPERTALFEAILGCARAVGVGAATADEIDLLGLTRAGELAMARAVRALPLSPDHLLLDAFRVPWLDIPQRPIIRGDRLCVSIAAASIVAKVVRDGWLGDLHARYPAYELIQHKGYGVSVHRRALAEHGPSAIHRRSYGPIAALVGGPG
jgi:ribonuclease HII